MGHFENTAMMHSMIQNWLDGQCRGINGIGGGLVLMFVPNQGALSQAAVWPVGAVTDQRLVGGSTDRIQSPASRDRRTVRR